MEISSPRVLMLGWEFPPALTGGLGVACEGLVGALGSMVPLRLWLPGMASGSGGAEVSPLDPYAGGGGAYGSDLAQRVKSFAEWAADRADAGEFDVIHAHDWMTIPAAWAVRGKTGRPMILHLHSLEFDRAGSGGSGWIRRIEQTGMRTADRVVVVSRYMAEVCVREYGIGPRRLEVVHNGVTPVETWKVDTGSPKLLFVGRFTDQKSPEVFVRMAERVARRIPEATFVMAGDGELLDPMRRLAAELGLAGRIRFPGFLQRGQLNAELATTSLLCLPSRSEPFGLVALEAAQFGVPTVAFPQCGATEVLASSEIVKKPGPDAMADAVCELLSDPERLAGRGRQARAEAADSTWACAAERFLRIYRSLSNGLQNSG
ncbi:glycosyltransferase family 4 protein [Haloferula helveola]